MQSFIIPLNLYLLDITLLYIHKILIDVKIIMNLELKLVFIIKYKYC